MIRLTRINHQEIVLNSDLIEHMEANPDTVITLTSGQKMMVLETPDEIIERVVSFRRRIAPPCANGPEPIG
ncbi:MAG TPA: flagellar FlbD family protein [Bryobacteraceae bacterium]|nr:flagellar FlbD family protein [Bryobacteraceae bacterium]